MRRIRVRPQGTAERFVCEEVPEPAPEPGRLVVRTEAVGVSVGLLRMLASDPLPEAGPGGEMVGHVTAVGPGVESYAVGDRVGGVVFGGLYAEYVLASPALVSHVPPEPSAGEALALVRGGLIALSALRAGRFAPGESVLVTAAASGTGHLAVQLAKALGAERVVAAIGAGHPAGARHGGGTEGAGEAGATGEAGPAAGSSLAVEGQGGFTEKAAFVRDCGADAVTGYADADWGAPVDLVLDGVGGELVQRGVDALAPYGRLVAFSAGGGSVDAGSLLGGLKSVTGFSIGLIGRERPDLLDERRAELWRLWAAGLLRPRYTALPLTGIARATALLASRTNRGRVLLTME
ncbi:NADPH:quinone reductase [Actinacidiphila yanglinensis]|uniref:NADPH:quinone reductase n=1 Tax=Actinacidiphila yanglinensis TaxID=310779 RepID=A0A1H6CWL0_9ACTN|nr:zinc-binding dehydrogenase [Actinacidiphila yanglinensis]SEG77113.1 NADPH:quinone reductase [Actinacidiphila yanglinensis]